MASVIELVIKAKNEAGQKLKQVEREANAMANNLRKNTEFMRGAFAAIGTAVLAAATAVAAGAAKAIGAYMESERAVANLREAHRAWGDEVDKNIERETAFASALMAQTNVDDESITNSMAQLRMLGMRTEALEDGAKAVIALTRAGAGEEGAARLVAAAYQGNYDRLQRYIPALRNASTESEKAAIVNDFLTKQLSAQVGETNTLGGQWAALKIQASETLEGMGKALNDSGVVQSGLRTIKQLVSDIGDSFGEWAAGGGIEETAGMFRNMGSFVTGGIIESTTTQANRLQGMSKEEWKKQNGLSPMPEKAVKPISIGSRDPEIALRAKRSADAIASARAVAAEQQKAEQSRYEAERNNIERRISYEQGAQAEVINLRVKQELDAAKMVHDARMKAIADEASAKFDSAALVSGGKKNDVVSDVNAGSARVSGGKKDDVFSDVNAGSARGSGGKETSEQIRATQNAIDAAVKAGKAEIDAAEKASNEREKSHENVMAMIAKLRSDEAKLAGDIAKEAEDTEKKKKEAGEKAKLDAQEAAAKGKIAAIDKLSDERKTLSEGPRAFKARIKEEQAAERKKRDDELRYQRLKAAEKKRGLTLSPEDKAFMADFEAIKGAEQAKVDLAAIEEKRLKLQQDATTAINNLLIEQKDVNTALQQLLVLRG